MESPRILVTGFPENTTETDLIIHFQSMRDSGGDQVESIKIDQGRAEIIFEDVKVATRVFNRPNHIFRGCRLQVFLLPKQAFSSKAQKAPATFHEDVGIASPTTTEWKDKSSLCINELDRKQTIALSDTHELLDPPHSSSLSGSAAYPTQCTIEVMGLPPGATEDLVINYFENEKISKGGPVIDVIFSPEHQTCKVTFESPRDAIRTVQHTPHNLSGACLSVSLCEEFEEETADDSEVNTEDHEEKITIIVSGISASTTEDAVCNYFKNSRRSGGGDVHKIDHKVDGDTVITFLEVKDLQRLLEGTHSIDGKRITVKRQKKVPLDPALIHIQGLSKYTTEVCLSFYLEKFCDNASVKNVYFGSNKNALAVFDEEPDFRLLLDKVHKDPKGLDKCKLRLERVPICTSILVTGLRDKTSQDAIQLYFENKKRSGGEDVSHVERKGKDKAIVSFEDPGSIRNVIQKNHTLEDRQLNVIPYYPFLRDETTVKIEVALDPEVFHYIQQNHGRELQKMLEECKAQVELLEADSHSQMQIVALSPMDNKTTSVESWKEAVQWVENFLHSFKKGQLDIAAEIFDEIVQRWQKQNNTQGSVEFQISFDNHRRQVQIIGKEAYVDKENQKLQELIHGVTQNAKLMKSVVKVVEDGIPMSKLALLEKSGIFERLRDEYQHLNITIDSNGQKLCLEGPRSQLQDVRIQVLTFISKIAELTAELPAKVITVLKRPQVSKFVEEVLKKKSVQAVVLYDQQQSSNEIQLVGVDLRSTQEAERILRDNIKERSIHLSLENAKVLESSLWKDFQSTVTSKFKVGISVDNSASTIWVTGITEDVEESFKQVKAFLEKNTILYTTIPTEYGTRRFLTEVWRDKLDNIKKELAHYSIDMRVTTDSEGIDIAGTAEGLQKCMPMLGELISAVQKGTVPVDKPGMKKFFLNGGGPHVLREIGEKHRCVILPSERTNGKGADGVRVTEDEELESSFNMETICTYLTRQEKKISVLKGDITKERVDAIVNAANGDLNHIGGLAAAIVQAGGREIQDECTAFVRKKGRPLEGQTMISTAGRLPCNQIIHAVGPRWDYKATELRKEGVTTSQEKYLKFAIKNSLKEAEKMRSIAIPAVSSGIFGVPLEVCAGVIIDAILDFCQENPSCNLSEIHLVDINTSTVKTFADEMKKRFSQDRNFIDQMTNPKPRAASKFASYSKEGEKSFGIQGMRITVKSGDLSKEQADILVGTAASNLNLKQNPLAKALSQAAGPNLQKECTKTGPTAVGDIAVNNQPGNLNCKAVIFAICCEWESGKGKKVLKDLVRKCLQAASTMEMTSIAFPAIGTGILRFPRAEVAEIYFDEVMSFNQSNPTTSLKEVKFVLYDQDYPTVQAFDKEFKKRMANNSPPSADKRRDFLQKDLSKSVKISQPSSPEISPFSPLKEREHDQLETNVGTLCFKVQPGDITQETTDAIVIISNGDLDIKRGGGAGAAILRSGGRSIQRECSLKGPQNPGSVVVTSAGKLSTRFIFHIVPLDPLNDKSITASVLKCLQVAEKRKLSSISFPAIGTGALGISPKGCADAMLSAIREFSENRPVFMKLIKMVIFQKKMLKDVRSSIEEASGESSAEKRGLFRRVASHFGSFLGFGDHERSAVSNAASLNTNDKALDLYIFAGCIEDLEGAVNKVNEIIDEKSTKQVIEHDAITILIERHIQRIHTLELRYEVKATVEREVGRIILGGQAGDLVNVVGEIHKMLHEVKEEHELKRAKELAKDIQWMYKDGDKLVSYDTCTNAKIEYAHHENKPDVSIEGGYKIVFRTMNVQDVFGTDVTEVQRVDRRALPLPKHWTPQPKDQKGIEKAVHLHQLDPANDATEYRLVNDQFQRTSGNEVIEKIERVQNPVLYATYAIRRQKMAEAKGGNEMWLFHGTAGENTQLINKTGFNRNFCGKNAAFYGNGVYFASDASYSARSTYSPPDSNGLKYMYLARVLVGEYTVGRPGLLTPPPKDQDPTDTFDSVVDQIPNPGIFVAFYDWQCYPEYLITFK